MHYVNKRGEFDGVAPHEFVEWLEGDKPTRVSEKQQNRGRLNAIISHVLSQGEHVPLLLINQAKDGEKGRS